MLVGAVRRLAGQGGDPVVQLQTNFGGGKTHSMLALYHLFSGIAPTELAGIDAVMQEAGAKSSAGRTACGAGGQQDLARQSRRPNLTARWCARCGASWLGNWAARRPLPASRPTMRRRPAPAMCCANCLLSTGRA